MEENIRKHITYNSLLILTKLLIVTAAVLYFNYKAAIVLLWIAVFYIVVWSIIYAVSKSNFKKYFKAMRKLMMLFVVFEAPNFFKFDFNPVGTIKKSKYSYDSYWLYSYLKRRDFTITDKELLKKQVINEMEKLCNSIKRVNYIMISSIIVTSLAYWLMQAQFSSFEYTNAIFVILTAFNLLVLTHNMFMKILIRKNNQIIYDAFDSKHYDKALRYSIIFLGMTKKSLYKTKKTSYLKSFESSYIY